VEHLHHFQLSGDPFRNEPLLKSYVESEPHQGALQRLERAVRQGKGLCVLTGETGAGKTMVVRRLLECLEEEVFEASMMVVLDGAADASWMLKRFVRQLGVEDPAPEREGMIAQIYDQLAIVREDGRQPVLIIDDAHALAKHGALAEVCSLLKLEYEDRRLLTLVLAGPVELDRSLSADASLAHRIDVRVELASLKPRHHRRRSARSTSRIGPWIPGPDEHAGRQRAIRSIHLRPKPDDPHRRRASPQRSRLGGGRAEHLQPDDRQLERARPGSTAIAASCRRSSPATDPERTRPRTGVDVPGGAGCRGTAAAEYGTAEDRRTRARRSAGRTDRRLLIGFRRQTPAALHSTVTAPLPQADRLRSAVATPARPCQSWGKRE